MSDILLSKGSVRAPVGFLQRVLMVLLWQILPQILIIRNSLSRKPALYYIGTLDPVGCSKLLKTWLP